ALSAERKCNPQMDALLDIALTDTNDRLIIQSRSVSAKGTKLGNEPSAQRFGGREINGAQQFDQPFATEFRSSWIVRFGHAVAVQDHNIAGLRSDDQPVISDVRQQAKRHTGHATSF